MWVMAEEIIEPTADSPIVPEQTPPPADTAVSEPVVEPLATPVVEEPVLVPAPIVTTEPVPTPAPTPVAEATSTPLVVEPVVPAEVSPPPYKDKAVEVVPPAQAEVGPRHPPELPREYLLEMLVKGRAIIKKERQANLDQVVALAKEKGKIKNADVRKLLGIKHAAATVYLQELTRAGKLRKTGRLISTRYEIAE